MRSDETNREPSVVEVYNRNGALWVRDPHVGENPLDVYHRNLIRIEWRKANPDPERPATPANPPAPAK